MPVIEMMKTSFNAGIWSKKLDARTDLSRYSAACSELINFIPDPYGGISNRAGTEFIFSLGSKKVRLIPFQFNSEQSYILAFYEGGGVVIKDGGIILDNSTNIYGFSHPYKEEDLQSIQYTQSADVLYLTHAKYRPATMTRNGHSDWIYADLFLTSKVPTPKSLEVTAVKTSGSNYWYGVTLVDHDGNESEIKEAYMQARVGDKLNFGKSPSEYGCLKYNIYREDNGIYGWVDDTTEASWTDPNAGGTNPDMSATPPVERDPFKNAGDYPTCSCIHQGRLIFAGSDSKPRSIFGSRSGSFTNFSIRSPLQDDDAYEFEISGGEVNRIEWMRSFSKDLLVGCGGGEYLVTGEGTGTAITPNSISVEQQTGYGVASIPSVVAGDDVLFVQRGKNIIRSTLYEALQDKYSGNNVAMLAEELFAGHKITSIAWQRDPEYILWCVRDDGILLGLTYVKNEKVWAWHKHQTKGKYTDVAVIEDGSSEDRVYFVIERNREYCIELSRSRELKCDINNAWFLDSAVEYEGEAVSKLIGLEHLEGEVVSAFSAGSVIEGISVTAGSIELPFPVESAVVGLPFRSEVVSMEVAVPAEAQFNMSVINNIIGATVYLQDSCQCLVSGTGGDKAEDWQSVVVSAQHDVAAPYTLGSGKLYHVLENKHKVSEREVKRNRFHLRNELPLPLNLCAVGIRVDMGDVK